MYGSNNVNHFILFLFVDNKGYVCGSSNFNHFILLLFADDTGYVSGSSNHYSEPYGCHEDGTQDRTRPTSRPGLPQVKGSPQPPRLPDNHPWRQDEADGVT